MNKRPGSDRTVLSLRLHPSILGRKHDLLFAGRAAVASRQVIIDTGVIIPFFYGSAVTAPSWWHWEKHVPIRSGATPSSSCWLNFGAAPPFRLKTELRARGTTGRRYSERAPEQRADTNDCGKHGCLQHLIMLLRTSREGIKTSDDENKIQMYFNHQLGALLMKNIHVSIY